MRYFKTGFVLTAKGFVLTATGGALSAMCLSACGSGETANSVKSTSVNPGDLTPAILHSDPALSGPTLSKPKISPDGKLVTVLQGRSR